MLWMLVWRVGEGWTITSFIVDPISFRRRISRGRVQVYRLLGNEAMLRHNNVNEKKDIWVQIKLIFLFLEYEFPRADKFGLDFNLWEPRGVECLYESLLSKNGTTAFIHELYGYEHNETRFPILWRACIG